MIWFDQIEGLFKDIQKCREEGSKGKPGLFSALRHLPHLLNPPKSILFTDQDIKDKLTAVLEPLYFVCAIYLTTYGDTKIADAADIAARKIEEQARGTYRLFKLNDSETTYETSNPEVVNSREVLG